MLSDRQKRILQAIVDDYVLTAEPIGSRTIARDHSLSLSSATIRNEMKDLEDLGYLEQPHTSAGRVPSDKGYRLYVDELMNPSDLPEYEIDSIEKMMEEKIVEMRQLLKRASLVLSRVTKYTSVAMDCTNTKEEPEVYLEGTANIFNHPEFCDVSRAREFLHVLDEKSLLYKILTSNIESSTINVQIGSENDIENIKTCSIVTATYEVGGILLGTVGVIGPTRMEYPRVISLMNHIKIKIKEMKRGDSTK